MPVEIYTSLTMGISDLKKDPMSVLESGEPVAILNRNTPVFYCVPAEVYHRMVDTLESAEEDAIDTGIIHARKDSKRIRIENPEAL